MFGGFIPHLHKSLVPHHSQNVPTLASSVRRQGCHELSCYVLYVPQYAFTTHRVISKFQGHLSRLVRFLFDDWGFQYPEVCFLRDTTARMSKSDTYSHCALEFDSTWSSGVHLQGSPCSDARSNGVYQRKHRYSTSYLRRTTSSSS